MSSLDSVRTQRDPKFTRGERCIFAHIVTTFVLIIILVIIYVVHLILVEHKGNDMFKVTRRHSTIINESVLIDYKGLGLVYLTIKPLRAVCNTVLVKKRWSMAPGHCVAARSEPHLSNLLPSWTIKYRADSYLYTESRVIRSIAHPHFSPDDLNNNIGLFEHEEFPLIQLFKCERDRSSTVSKAWISDKLAGWLHDGYIIQNQELFKKSRIYLILSSQVEFYHVKQDIPIKNPSSPGISLEEIATGNMGFISWDLISNPSVMHKDIIVRTTVKGPMKYDECNLYVSPISSLRSHEFCVVVGKGNNAVLVHGAVLYINSNIVGFFSWGQKQSREFPIVILNITSFKDWLDYVTS